MKKVALVAVAGGVLVGIISCGKKPPSEKTVAVATAGAAQLSVQSLAGLLGRSMVPLRKEEVTAIVDQWIDSQLLAKAAATGDSLSDETLLDRATWAQVANARARLWYERVSKTWPLTIGDPRAMYDGGQILAARQILLAVPQTALPIQRTAIRQSIDSLRRALTTANFAANARKYSTDEVSARVGGLLPAWPARRAVMVPVFEAGVLATRPGAISGLISSPFGVHIIYRLTYAEAAAPVALVVRQLAVQRAESVYFAALESANTVRVASDAPKLVRAIVADPTGVADTGVVLATTKHGDFTGAKMMRWVSAYPAGQGMQAALANAPDTLVPKIIRDLVRNEIFLRQADSAGIVLSPKQVAGYRRDLQSFVLSAWGTLGIAPAMLADSVRKLPPAALEQFMIRRIDTFIANMVSKQGLVVQIPRPLRELLRARYPAVTVSRAGIDAALDQAASMRSKLPTPAR